MLTHLRTVGEEMHGLHHTGADAQRAQLTLVGGVVHQQHYQGAEAGVGNGLILRVLQQRFGHHLARTRRHQFMLQIL
jgi:hypothetical protein